jgi:peptidyl-prolyl cis-trans isomerase C
MRLLCHRSRVKTDMHVRYRTSRRSRWNVASLALGMLLSLAGGIGCGDKKGDQAKKADAPKPPPLQNGLTEEQSKQVLAKVGDTTITLGEFADRLAGQSPYLRARYQSPERRKEFLDNMVRFELLALEAKKRGQDKLPEVQRVREQMMVQQMMKELFDDQGVKLSDITDKEIQAYYDQNQAEFHKPAQRRASHILFKDKAKAEGVLKKLLAAPDDMELFRKLAEQNNLDESTKDRFGDLRFFGAEPAAGETGPPKPVRDAAFKLAKTGDLSPELIQSEQGFHIVKLTGERAALDRTLEDARRLIQNRLWRKKREDAIEAFVTELRGKAELKENLELLSQVKVDTSTAGAPGAPGAPGAAAGDDADGESEEKE